MRVAARSRFRAAPPDGEPSPDVWLPSSLKAREDASGGMRVVEHAEAVPAEPAVAAELGAEVQKRAANNTERAERAERELVRLGERIEAMKRAAAQAAVIAHPDDERTTGDGRLDLNAASFEQLRALGLSVTQAARLIGQREQHGGFAAVDDVDGINGIPKDVKQTLKQHGSV